MIYRVDLHVHTDGAASLDELARAARRAGLDAIAVTDRGRLTPVPAEVRGVLLIPGCEIATLGGHILGVFLERAPDFARLQRHGLPTADEAVLEIHRCGGLAILAHPYAEKTANAASLSPAARRRGDRQSPGRPGPARRQQARPALGGGPPAAPGGLQRRPHPSGSGLRLYGDLLRPADPRRPEGGRGPGPLPPRGRAGRRAGAPAQEKAGKEKRRPLRPHPGRGRSGLRRFGRCPRRSCPDPPSPPKKKEKRRVKNSRRSVLREFFRSRAPLRAFILYPCCRSRRGRGPPGAPPVQRRSSAGFPRCGTGRCGRPARYRCPGWHKRACATRRCRRSSCRR